MRISRRLRGKRLYCGWVYCICPTSFYIYEVYRLIPPRPHTRYRYVQPYARYPYPLSPKKNYPRYTHKTRFPIKR